MAIIKHLSSKSSNYQKAIDYLMYQQDRLNHEALRNEDGDYLMREHFLIDSIDCNVDSFDLECEQLNRTYKKNQKYSDVKSHHYIISFDPKDSIEGKLTLEEAQKIGMEFSKKNFPGHQTIVCTHLDGEHESGNIHIHIVINSLRNRDVARQSFMERDCDSKAGFKHHLTDKYLNYLKKDIMNICKNRGLHQVDLLSPSKNRIPEKEYWAGERRRMKYGSKFLLEKEKLRMNITTCAKKAISEQEFARLLKESCGITLTISRGRYGYILPNRKKPIRGRILGTAYEEAQLREVFKENKKNRIITIDDVIVDLEAMRDKRHATYQSRKLKNLKDAAQSLLYMQEHGFKSKESLDNAYREKRRNLQNARTALDNKEKEIKAINEQIHYTGQYSIYKNLYAQYRKARNKEKFYDQHTRELVIFEAAQRYLLENIKNGTLPSLAYIQTGANQYPSVKQLKDIRTKLIESQKQVRQEYYALKDKTDELYAVKRDIERFVSEPSRDKDRNKDKKRNREESR